MATRCPTGDDYEITGEPTDTIERLRRYRVLRSDGRTEMLTRAELDELRAFRQVRAARRARSFVWRPRLAIGVAVASLSIVASIVGRELNPFTPASALLPVPDVGAEASPGRIDASSAVRGAGGPEARSLAAERHSPSAPAKPSTAPMAMPMPTAVPTASVAAQPVRRRPDALSRPARADAPTIEAPLAGEPALMGDEDTRSGRGDGAAGPALMRASSRGVASAPAEAPRDAADAVFERWLGAWRARDVDAYLAIYGRAFARWGLSPEAWARSRRNRLSSVDWIEVEVEDLVRMAVSTDIIRYTFRQHYRDPGYADESLKVLVLEERDGRWLITAESDRVLRRGRG